MDFPDQLTAEQTAEMQRQGLINVIGDPGATTTNSPTMGIGRAALAPLAAHAGGITAGGIASLAGPTLAKLAIPWLAGPEAGLPADLALMTIGAGSAIAGGYGGQKAQEDIEGPAEQQALEDELQKAQEAHPIVTAGSDIAASALASGGKFSPSEAGDAGRAVLAKLGIGEGSAEASSALRNVAIQALVNPAINTGVGVAAGQGLPSISDLAQQSLGGALFARPNVLGRFVHSLTDNAEPSAKSDTATETDQPKGSAEGIIGSVDQPLTDKTRTTTSSTDIKNTGIVSPAAEDIAKQQSSVLQSTGVQLPVKYQDVGKGWGPHDQQDRPLEINPDTKQWQLKDTSSPVVVPTQVPGETQNVSEQKGDASGARPADSQPSALLDAPGRVGLPAVPADVSPPAEALNENRLSSSGTAAPRTDSAVFPEPITDETEGVITKPVKGAMGPDSLVMTPLDKTSPRTEVGAPLGAALVAHIDNEDTSRPSTVGSTLKIIAGSNHPQAELAKTMLEGMDKDSLGVKINHDPTLDITNDKRSHYRPSKDVINLGTPNLTNVNTILHEASHAALYEKIPAKLHGSNALKAQQDYLNNPKGDENVKEIIRSYHEAARQLGIDIELANHSKYTNADQAHNAGLPHGYAMGNIDEFMAGFLSNRKFQEHLNSMPDGIPNSKGTLWGRLTRAISNLLGIKGVKAKSLLERVLKPTEALMKQERIGKGADGEKVSAPPASKVHGTPVDKEERKGGLFGKTFRAAIDRVSDIPRPSAKTLANAFKSTFDKKQQLEGKWKNSIITTAQKVRPSDADEKRVVDIRHLESTTNRSHAYMINNDKQRALYDAEHASHKASGEHAIKINEPVMRNGVPSTRKLNAYHYGQTPTPNVLDIYRKGTDKPAIAKLDQDFKDHIISQGKTPGFADEQLKEWKKSIMGNSRSLSTVSNQDYFSGARKAQGLGLPRSFIGDSLTKNASRYYSRLAMDAAHYEHIESDPAVSGALGNTKDAWGKDIPPTGDDSLASHPDVQNVLGEFKGELQNSGDKLEHSISSTLATMFISSPPLEGHKIIGNQVGVVGLCNNPWQVTRVLGHALTHFNEGYHDAVAAGTVKLSARKWTDLFNGQLSFAERLSGLAQGVQNISTLNGLTTRLSYGLMHASLDVVIPEKIHNAANGDRTDQQFLKHLDSSYTVGKLYSPEEIKHLSSVASNYIHGTGDARTMPAWMLKDNEISGFFQLAHWSIAQTNRFMRDIYTPATKGDVAPLLHSVFGAVIGGYLIKELREELQGKKGQIPSLKDIANSDKGIEGNTSLVAYNMIAAMQYAGFGGMLSQIAKYPFDFVYKNQPQGATFPLDEVASDLASTLKNVSSAIANDPNVNWMKLAQAVTSHVLSNNFQLGRMALNQGINSGLVTGTLADKKHLADRMGELRRFDEVEGLPYNEIDEASNPYMNLEQKGFKNTQDIAQAAKMLPGLVQNIIQTYRSQPDVMREKLEALKTNEYGTFPSMEKMPLSFVKYLGYLQKEEGPEKAQSELRDYVLHNAINKAKEEMVP